MRLIRAFKAEGMSTITFDVQVGDIFALNGFITVRTRTPFKCLITFYIVLHEELIVSNCAIK